MYAVVNSICATCDDITGVRFEIEGDASVRFRDEVELDQEFSMNRSYLPDDETGTAQETVQTESETDLRRLPKRLHSRQSRSLIRDRL